MRAHWKTIALFAIVAAVALSAVAVAYGATKSQAPRRSAGKNACGTLMSNPKALKAMQGLRAEHQADMQAWYEQYGSDPSTPEAQAALQTLREEHWKDMSELFKRYGVKVRAGSGPGAMMRGGGCGGACGGAGAGAPQGAGYGGGMMGNWN